MPARKKDPSTRARRNKVATKATLTRAEETVSREDYEAMNMVTLREAIDLANLSRPADAQLSKGGTKAAIIESLVAANNSIPDLPSHPPRWDADGYEVETSWHLQTEAWWAAVWTSPMAMQWDASDVHNVFVVALLYDDIWTAPTAKARKDAMAEYRLQRADLGLSPYARRRLEWTIETAEEAKERGQKRRGNGSPSKPPAKQPTPANDPRAHLAVVS
ncbi:hypothetical protein [Nocardioides sp.]|uniref:phage terminase small subunit n=1 Tax=Nocardioides sp. TaxID=35761 RepID=UPI00261EAE26|nr:hypothetical protein [Nocardioides sp.]